MSANKYMLQKCSSSKVSLRSRRSCLRYLRFSFNSEDPEEKQWTIFWMHSFLIFSMSLRTFWILWKWYNFEESFCILYPRRDFNAYWIFVRDRRLDCKQIYRQKVELQLVLHEDSWVPCEFSQNLLRSRVYALVLSVFE